MRKNSWAIAAVLGLALVLVGGRSGAQTPAQSSIEEIRKELMQLPYYGVFDFIAFSYQKGTVTLMGYAYRSALKGDAVHAVKHASGVDEVLDKDEELPPSQIDDELRWKVYCSIYRDPFLARYAPGGGMLWGHRHSPGAGFQSLGSAAFAGMEPAGDYPIHIIVKNGRVILLGVVDNDGDKTLAGMKAGEVPGSFRVDNELTVEKASKSTQ